MKASLNKLASASILAACLVGLGYWADLTFAVRESNGKSLSLRLALADIGSHVPDPTSITAHVWRQLHVRRNCDINQPVL